MDTKEKNKIAQQAGLPLKIVEYWLGNTRKKARKIARTEGKLPPSGTASATLPAHPPEERAPAVLDCVVTLCALCVGSVQVGRR